MRDVGAGWIRLAALAKGQRKLKYNSLSREWGEGKRSVNKKQVYTCLRPENSLGTGDAGYL